MKWINLLNQVGAHPPGKKLRVDAASAAVLVMRADAEYIDDPATPDVDESLGFVFTINGRSGQVDLTKADLGLSKVDNTSDDEKPISELVAAELDGKLSITDAPDVVATAITSPEVQTALDATYAPLDLVADGITYNPDGTVASSTEGGITTTYTWNTDGTCHTETRLGKVKTWTYDGAGNPTSSTVTEA
ncbi:minor tail protein [Gordonia phage Ruthy]|uniref:Minor tail protein n=1 Tax=Gordonia phage Ruthy TaxID=2250323 RepID=A0A345L5E1_9CAUD|nr:minor tail protein [Gordonia phage Ruthy]AXH50493.1 minor tail protein [Gordonia phage Ruthy]